MALHYDLTGCTNLPARARLGSGHDDANLTGDVIFLTMELGVRILDDEGVDLMIARLAELEGREEPFYQRRPEYVAALTSHIPLCYGLVTNAREYDAVAWAAMLDRRCGPRKEG